MPDRLILLPPLEPAQNLDPLEILDAVKRRPALLPFRYQRPSNGLTVG